MTQKDEETCSWLHSCDHGQQTWTPKCGLAPEATTHWTLAMSHPPAGAEQPRREAGGSGCGEGRSSPERGLEKRRLGGPAGPAGADARHMGPLEAITGGQHP